MLTEPELKAAIARQAHFAQSVAGSPLLPQVVGVLQGLVQALTGTPRPDVRTAAQACEAAGIPFQASENGKVVMDPAWLRAAGVELNLGRGVRGQ